MIAGNHKDYILPRCISAAVTRKGLKCWVQNYWHPQNEYPVMLQWRQCTSTVNTDQRRMCRSSQLHKFSSSTIVMLLCVHIIKSLKYKWMASVQLLEKRHGSVQVISELPQCTSQQSSDVTPGSRGFPFYLASFFFSPKTLVVCATKVIYLHSCILSNLCSYYDDDVSSHFS